MKPIRPLFQIVALLLIMSFPAASFSADELTGFGAKKTMVVSLEQCVQYALSENQKLRAAGYGVDAAKAQLMEAHARWWPVLEYEFRAAPVPQNVDDAVNSFFSGNVVGFFSYKMVLGIPITAFGQLTAAQELAKGGIRAAEHNVLKERSQLIYDVKRIYYGILMGAEMVKLLESAVNSLGNKIKEQDEAEDPQHSPYDLLKMKVFKEELVRRLDKANMEMKLAYVGLAIQMGLPPEVDVKLDKSALEPEVVDLAAMDQYIKASMEERPESKLIEIGVDTKQKLWKLEKKKLAPKMGVGFYFDIGRTHQDISGVTATDDFNNPFNYTRAGVGLQLKGQLDFHGSYSRIKKAGAEYLKALYEGEMGKKGLKLDAEKAYEEVVKAKKVVLSSKKSQSMANQMVFLSKSNYELGLGEQDEYADALQLLLMSRGQYFQAVFDYNSALANLENKVGSDAYARLTGRPNIPAYEAFSVEEEPLPAGGGMDDNEDIDETIGE